MAGEGHKEMKEIQRHGASSGFHDRGGAVVQTPRSALTQTRAIAGCSLWYLLAISGRQRCSGSECKCVRATRHPAQTYYLANQE